MVAKREGERRLLCGAITGIAFWVIMRIPCMSKQKGMLTLRVQRDAVKIDQLEGRNIYKECQYFIDSLMKILCIELY